MATGLGSKLSAGVAEKDVERFDAAELSRRIAHIVPGVRERAAEAERLGRMPPETFAEMRDAKLFRIAQPPMFGGVGLDMDEVYQLGFELARVDPSTGWVAAFYALHGHQIGMFPRETQEEFWGPSYDTLMVTASAIVRAEFKEEGDCVRVNGEWDFASGLDQAEWVLVNRIVENGAQQLLIPRANFEVIDNWQVAGAKATGSKRVRVLDARVPPHHILDGAALANAKTFGRKLHPSRYYKLPTFIWMSYVITVVIMGAAQGMVDLFAEQAKKRREMTTGDLFVDRAANQIRIAEASAEVNAARQIMAADIKRFHEWTNAAYEPSMIERAEVRRNGAYCAKLAQQAAYRLFEVGGANSIYDKNPLQRFYRDISVMTHSIAVVWDPIAEQYARVLWNLPPKS